MRPAWPLVLAGFIARDQLPMSPDRFVSVHPLRIRLERKVLSSQLSHFVTHVDNGLSFLYDISPLVEPLTVLLVFKLPDPLKMAHCLPQLRDSRTHRLPVYE